MSASSIQWTDVTDNIIRVIGGGWWCRKISPGCANCYAATLNQNTFFGGNQLRYTGEPPKLLLDRDLLTSWTRQTKPKKHFVASMTDVFGEWVPQKWIFEFLDAMRAAPLQTFQVLTKRAERMRIEMNAWLKARGLERLPDNIWPGVSVENQKCANLRLPQLVKIPALTHWISAEPLLEAVDFDVWLFSGYMEAPFDDCVTWVVFGGESGKGARACNTEWIRAGIAQCRKSDVAIFVKQLGKLCICDNANLYEWPADISLVETDKATGFASCRVITADKKGGEISEWPEDLRIREFPILVSNINPKPKCSMAAGPS